MLIYNGQTGQVSTEKVRSPEAYEIVWIRLKRPSEAEVRRVLDDLFQCHPLLIEDCIKLNQRPKLDRYQNQLFMSFFAIHGSDYSAQEMAIVIGANYVITIYQDEIPFLENVYREFQEIEGRMDHTSEILYHILDRCVDTYSDIVNTIEGKVDRMERDIYQNPNAQVAQDIFQLKRHLHQLRRIFSEEKTILGAIAHQNLPFMRQEADAYFIDIYDHISRAIDSIDIFRESLTGILDLQMNLKSDRMNEIMKTLTVFSTFFLPLTFIVGLYGMNFHNMPELAWPLGYAFVWVIMIGVAIAMWVFFKRRKWW